MNAAGEDSAGRTLRSEKAKEEAAGGNEKSGHRLGGGRQGRKNATPFIGAVAGDRRWIRSEKVSLNFRLRTGCRAGEQIGKMCVTRSTSDQKDANNRKTNLGTGENG